MNTPTLVTRWAGEHRFDSGRENGPTLRLDGSGETGQSPVDAMLSALAGCSGIDLVDIMAKRRTPVESLEIVTNAVRRDTAPKRVESARVSYRVTGAGIDRDQAERAIALAFEKYCSVAASLSPAMRVETQLVVNGEEGPWVHQPIPG